MGAGQDPAAAGAGEPGPDVVSQLESMADEYQTAPSQQLEHAITQLVIQMFAKSPDTDNDQDNQQGAPGGAMPPEAASGMGAPGGGMAAGAPPAAGGGGAGLAAGQKLFRRGGKVPTAKPGQAVSKLPELAPVKRTMKKS